VVQPATLMDVLYDPAEHSTHTRFAALWQSVNW
jgi:hypothetical protein